MATDILTQLQTCYDQLLTQYFSTISYLSQRHPLIAPEPVPGDPYTDTPLNEAFESASSQLTFKHRYVDAPVGEQDTIGAMFPLEPVPPPSFQEAQRDLAEDLVRKGQQIEYLIRKLPGLGSGEEQQAEEIRQLVENVHDMEKRRKRKRKEMKECIRQLDDVVMGMASSINFDRASTAKHHAVNVHTNGA